MRCPTCRTELHDVDGQVALIGQVVKGGRASLEEAEIVSRRIGRSLSAQMPRQWGFFLLLFSFGEDGFATHISSVERDDAIKMLREVLQRMEANRESDR